MKKTDALILRAIAALSVSLLAGCAATDANRGGASKIDAGYQSHFEKKSTREGNFVSETELATWVKFKNVNKARVFNAAAAALTSQGFAPAIDRKAGTIYGSHAAVSDSRQAPVLIRVKSDNKDVMVAISVSRVFGLMGSAADVMRGIKADIRQQLKVQAKGPVSVKQKQKKEPINARQKKKETALKQAAIKGDARTGDTPSGNTGRSVHFVCVPKCYVRQTPNTNSPAIAELLESDWVRVLKTKSSWCLVQTGAGSVGWMSQDMIK
jgi:type IV pilus biogenesis protein CpaD/CtpE